MFMPNPYFNTLEYTVVLGDTLTKIAHNYSSTVANILKLNKIPNPNYILSWLDKTLFISIPSRLSAYLIKYAILPSPAT